VAILRFPWQFRKHACSRFAVGKHCHHCSHAFWDLIFSGHQGLGFLVCYRQSSGEDDQRNQPGGKKILKKNTTEVKIHSSAYIVTNILIMSDWSVKNEDGSFSKIKQNVSLALYFLLYIVIVKFSLKQNDGFHYQLQLP
jgi:hypothetical protein